MRILHILDHSIPLHSGYTFRSRAILQEQRRRGWETFHVTSPKHNLGEPVVDRVEDVDGLEFYRTRTPTGLWSSMPVLDPLAVISTLTQRLEDVAQMVAPDVLHAHSPALNGVAAERVGRKLGIPVVYEVRAFWEDAAVDHGTSSEWGIRYRLTRSLETRVLRRASAVTTICEGLRGDIVSRGIPAERVTVIPNAVDIDAFSVGQPRDLELARTLGLTGKVVVGFIGSFYAYEGLNLLVQAMPAILSGNPDVRVVLVGGGPEADTLKGLAHNLGLDEKIEFVGRVPHDQVQRYYNLIDLFVYPRLSMRLTDLVTPLKPLEAMAQGRVVLASDVGVHGELIRDGDTGVLFD
ncbi:MAG: glycosyltransferase, exosortase A system-associated, partial [Gammaproteobacteria bacterium]